LDGVIAGLTTAKQVCRAENYYGKRRTPVRATRASLSCSRTALTDAPPTSTIFLSLAATRPSLRARSRHGLGRQSVLRSHCRPDQRHRFPSPSGDSVSMRPLGVLRIRRESCGRPYRERLCAGGLQSGYRLHVFEKEFLQFDVRADLSACKRQGPSISAFRTPPQEKRTQLDDAFQKSFPSACRVCVRLSKSAHREGDGYPR
jgi:hypothetical protein